MKLIQVKEKSRSVKKNMIAEFTEAFYASCPADSNFFKIEFTNVY